MSPAPPTLPGEGPQGLAGAHHPHCSAGTGAELWCRRAGLHPLLALQSLSHTGILVPAALGACKPFVSPGKQVQILSYLLQLLQDCPVSPWMSSSTPPAPPALLQFLQLFVGSAISSFREHRLGPSVARLCCNALGRNPPAPLSGACLTAGSPRNLPLLQLLCCLSIRI